MLALGGALAAYSANSALARSAERLVALVAFLRFVRSEVECFALPASDIIASCDKGLLARCGFEGEIPPRDMLSLVRMLTIEDTEARSLVLRFAEGFGQSYREEQIRECDYYISLLRQRAEQLSAAVPTKRRLNSTLCISAALALIILLF